MSSNAGQLYTINEWDLVLNTQGCRHVPDPLIYRYLTNLKTGSIKRMTKKSLIKGCLLLTLAHFPPPRMSGADGIGRGIGRIGLGWDDPRSTYARCAPFLETWPSAYEHDCFQYQQACSLRTRAHLPRANGDGTSSQSVRDQNRGCPVYHLSMLLLMNTVPAREYLT